MTFDLNDPGELMVKIHLMKMTWPRERLLINVQLAQCVGDSRIRLRM